MNAVKKKYRVLLLSAPIGSGHKLAAEALKQVLLKYDNVEVTHGNVFDFFPKFIGGAFLKTYLWILKQCPWLYKFAYTWGNKQSGSLVMRNLLNKLLAALGRSYLKSVNPDIVIATHATPAGILAVYKKQFKPDLRLGVVITDFTIHRWWLCDGVDCYFIADDKLKNKISVDADVQGLGIPIRQEFLQQDKAACRKMLGWSDKEKVCLLMGGGEGLLPMEAILARLVQFIAYGLRIIAITGHNRALEEGLRKKFKDTVEIYGFTDNVPQMMIGADMIVTKAGGLTSAEILAANLDFIIYKPLPGQEEGNAQFLKENYSAVIAGNAAEVAKNVIMLCEKDVAVRAENGSFGKPQAAENICKYMLNMVEKN